MKLHSLAHLLHDLLKDLYSAEHQLVKALPRMAKAATSDELREGMLSHLEQTRGHVERLEQISEALELPLKGKKCKAMEGLIEDARELLEADADDAVLDAGLIAAAQKVEHYEIASYGCARTWAEQLGLINTAQLLDATLAEEKATNEKLSQLAQAYVNREAEAPGAAPWNMHRSSARENGRARQ